MKNLFYYFGLICIAIFLFTIHAKYLHFLIPGNDVKLFKFSGFDLKIYLPYIWGAAFGIVTTIILHYLDKSDSHYWHFIFAVALLEFLGVFLFNNTEIKENWFRMFSSVYYGSYTAFIIIVYSYIKDINANGMQKENCKKIQNATNAKGKNDAIVMQMIKDGIAIDEIAKSLGINKSTVYRIIKKYENE